MRARFALVFSALVLLGQAVGGQAAESAAGTAPNLRYGLAQIGAGTALLLPSLDAAKALFEDSLAPKGRPLRYAIGHKVKLSPGVNGQAQFGQWTSVGDGQRLWRLTIVAPGALSIDIGIRNLHLPVGAALYFTDASGKFVRGPYRAADVPASGELWTPFVPGERALLQVLLPAAQEPQLRLALIRVNQAYRDIFSGDSPYAKSGSCNVDVACAAGDDHREQIRAVARYSVDGGLCTGQLINNAVGDNKRLFITANHCVSTPAEANSMVFYWKYENPSCRAPDSGASGTPLPVTGNAIEQTGGAILRAAHGTSDTTLVELNSPIPAAADPFWDGWDRSEGPKAGGVVIHHPQGDEKRISFETNALVLDNAAIDGVPGINHWRVNDWDLGTTEQGSSGSGLLSPEKRLIGVLSGGGAACGNNAPDWFGRLSTAWEGGGSLGTRVRDWLDPLASGATAIDGKGSCVGPTVLLSSDTASPSVDAEIRFTATISGGLAPYTLRWDVDGDGVSDRQSVLAAPGAVSLPVRYPVASSGTVSLSVTDASPCASTATRAIAVSAPNIVANGGAPTQLCGDNDAVLEPGERWQIPVTLSNTGGNGLNNGLAQFAPGAAAGSGVLLPNDSFGHRLVTSNTPVFGNTCPFQAINMSGAAAQPLTAAPDAISANDDGVTPPLSVGGGQPFLFYGQPITQLRMSTNGFLATNLEEDGSDFANTCGQFGSSFSNNGRMHALFDDLVVQPGGALTRQHFAVCPRASDAGTAGQGCTVFEWRNMGRFDNAGAVGSAVFQAVLYDQSFEIVYQYLSADPLAGGEATISVENAAQTDQLSAGCKLANQAPAGRAVCIFDPSALPAAIKDAEISFAGGAQQPVPDLVPGQGSTVNVPIHLPSTASCGAPLNVRYIGTVDDFSWSTNANTVLSTQVGATGNCQVVAGCPNTTTPLASAPRDGLYWSPNRQSNGIGMFNVPIPGGSSGVVAGTWFSGRPNRKPIWYLVNGLWQPDDTRADISLSNRVLSPPNVFPGSQRQVGGGVLSHDGSRYVLSWAIDGHTGMEKLVRTFDDSNLGVSSRTGLWFNPNEDGWGLTIDDHRLNGVFDSWVVSYIYDDQGEPTWTLGDAAQTSGTLEQVAFQVHCPWCPNLNDFVEQTRSEGGSLNRSFASPNSGVFGSSIVLPANGVQWTRNNLPIQLITVPLAP
ncbi:MAG: serine protease [Lysobacterales bacterium]